MKKTYLLTALLCLFVLQGCPSPAPEKEDAVLTPIQTTYSIGAEGGGVSISFNTNLQYKVSSDAAWLIVPASTKAVETKTVTVTAAQNTSTEQRSGNITIKGGDLTATVTVNQAGAQKKDDGGGDGSKEDEKEDDVLENGGLSTYTVDAAGATVEVIVRSNVAYTVAVSADWISQAVTKAVSEDRLRFTVAANQKEEVRSATISVSYNELAFTVTVNQRAYAAPQEEPYLEISPVRAYAVAAGEKLDVNVRANFEVEARSDADYVTCAMEGEVCHIDVAENTSADPRTALVYFFSEGLEEVFVINQAAAAGEDPFDVGSNLSANGTANCYVVLRAGSYTFDAGVMGNGEKGFIWTDDQALVQHLWPEYREDVSFSSVIYGGNAGPAGVKVLWQYGNVLDGEPVYDADNRTISFVTSGNEGNALLALVTKGGKVLWSWHIWCTDSPAQQRYKTLDGTYLTLLDRNLGATSADPDDGEETFGFWYQFGRKDPLRLYYNVKNSMVDPEAEMQHSVEHPATIYRHSSKTNEWFNNNAATVTADLWGNPFALNNGNDHHYTAALSELGKTIYDPCPPGYMVPPEWTWTGLNMDICSESEYGLTFEVESGMAFYPFAGYGDAGDMYGGDNGWYGYPGFAPTEANKDSSGYHHNEITIMAVWSSATTVEPSYGNFVRGSAFYFHRKPESDFDKANLSTLPRLYAIPDGDAMLYGCLRSRCASVRCMRIPD